MLRHPATKREVYAKKFFDEFGVNLYDPALNAQETEIEVDSNVEFFPEAAEDDAREGV
jgi:hypothetical protein